MTETKFRKRISTKDLDYFSDLVSLSKTLTEQGLSKNTKTAYNSDFTQFAYFCAKNDKKCLPADVETVSAYLASIIDKKYSTICRACVSIKRFHNESGHESPTESKSIKDLLKGIRRNNGISCDSATPILFDDLGKMVDAQERTIRGRRNQAILLLGWSAALRRSEIVALNVDDIKILPEGMTVKITRSKTDQEGKGSVLFIPRAPEGTLCCVGYVDRYLAFVTSTDNGPLFRRVRRTNLNMFYDFGNSERLSAQTITDIVKESSKLIGLDPLKYSAHSLRRGFATQCGRLGIPERFIARQTRHVSMEVLRKYIDDGSITLNNPLSMLYFSMLPDSRRRAKFPAHEEIDSIHSVSQDVLQVPAQPLDAQPLESPSVD
jgi:site-specific recombinase XerD